MMRAAVERGLDRGLDVAGTVKDTASEVLRTRRDPAHIAARRRAAAKRRVAVWSIAVIVLLGVGATGIAEIVGGEVTPGSVGALVLVLGLLTYCGYSGAGAARDLAARTRAVRRLPPPQPARRPVTGAARPLLSQLDGFSDALRASVGMIGLDRVPDPAVRELRDETLAAADAAEVRIRAKAAELGALQRATGGMAQPGIAETRDRLHGEIREGVAEYGRLVAAASEAAGAFAHLAARTEVSTLVEATDRLQALAMGMREITSHADGSIDR